MKIYYKSLKIIKILIMCYSGSLFFKIERWDAERILLIFHNAFYIFTILVIINILELFRKEK